MLDRLAVIKGRLLAGPRRPVRRDLETLLQRVPGLRSLPTGQLLATARLRALSMQTLQQETRAHKLRPEASLDIMVDFKRSED